MHVITTDDTCIPEFVKAKNFTDNFRFQSGLFLTLGALQQKVLRQEIRDHLKRVLLHCWIQ